MEKIKINLKNFLYALLTFISIYAYINMYIKNNIVEVLCYLLLFILFFLYYLKMSNSKENSLLYKIFNICLSFVLVLGYSYEITSTSKLFFGSIPLFIISLIKMMGYYIFFDKLIWWFNKYLEKEKKHQFKLLKLYEKHPFLWSFAFLFLCYSIFMIIYYPGIINYDNANQIKEVMGMHTRYLDAIIPISDSTLTNFNPIVHTLLLGGLFKTGCLLGNVNFGMFLYTFIQVLIVVSIYSYTLSYAVKNTKKGIYSFVITLILGLIPLFGFYSVTAVKDTLYAAFLLLFSLKVYDIFSKKDRTWLDYLLLYGTGVLVILFRNNGIYVVLLTLPWLLFKNKKLPVIIVVLLTFMSYSIFNNQILPAFGVSNTSIREMLSVPFQQTARLVKFRSNILSESDKQIINELLDYENLGKDYDEDLADPVKNKFKKDATDEEIKSYFKFWFKGLFKAPDIYFDATINNISGYFYPYDNDWKIYAKLNPKLPEAGFDYHYNKLSKARNVMEKYEVLIEFTPIGLILNIAFITWVSIFMFLKLINKKFDFVFLIPNIISILFCVLSPANTYYRYIYPSLILVLLLFPLIQSKVESFKNK